MNSITISGRLTFKPDLKTTGSGKNFTNFNVAVKRTKEITDFLPCQAWEGRAEFIAGHFDKGQRIEIIGQLQSYSYEKDGQTKTGYVINVDRAEFGETKAAAGKHTKPAQDDFISIPDGVDDEFPFD